MAKHELDMSKVTEARTDRRGVPIVSKVSKTTGGANYSVHSHDSTFDRVMGGGVC